ncbi:MAG TPA: hypothetical protein VE046_02370 [Steroidobacteraceae bacterium]|nr:hypothetical protein [Steroidobacteraceae bacterium]
MKAGCIACLLLIAVASTALADEREDLEKALVQALGRSNHDLINEENELPDSGPVTADALVYLLKKDCVRVARSGARNSWTIGPGCGGECRMGRFTSPLMPGTGLICRVARQADIHVIANAPPERNQRGDVIAHVNYTAKLVDVADWARDPEYVAIWTAYGLDLETFQAHADLVKTPDGWIPYE